MPTVLITDCTSSIGLASTKLFSAIGWNVIAAKRSRDSQIDMAPSERLWVTHLDVCDPAEIKEVIEQSVKRFGNIDILVVNALHHQIGLFEGIPRKKYIQHFGINVLGTMDMIRSIMPLFRQTHRGVIISVISSPDHSILPMMSSVYASNSALEGFLHAFIPEAASQGILVKLVMRYLGPSDMIFKEHALSHLADCSLTDYHDYIKVSEEVLMKKKVGSRKSEEVARAIYNAATDGSSRFRYLVGTENASHSEGRGDRVDGSTELRTNI